MDNVQWKCIDEPTYMAVHEALFTEFNQSDIEGQSQDQVHARLLSNSNTTEGRHFKTILFQKYFGTMAIRLLIVCKEVGTFQVAKGLAFLQIA